MYAPSLFFFVQAKSGSERGSTSNKIQTPNGSSAQDGVQSSKEGEEEAKEIEEEKFQKLVKEMRECNIPEDKIKEILGLRGIAGGSGIKRTDQGRTGESKRAERSDGGQVVSRKRKPSTEDKSNDEVEGGGEEQTSSLRRRESPTKGRPKAASEAARQVDDERTNGQVSGGPMSSSPGKRALKGGDEVKHSEKGLSNTGVQTEALGQPAASAHSPRPSVPEPPCGNVVNSPTPVAHPTPYRIRLSDDTRNKLVRTALNKENGAASRGTCGCPIGNSIDSSASTFFTYPKSGSYLFCRSAYPPPSCEHTMEGSVTTGEFKKRRGIRARAREAQRRRGTIF